MHLKNVHLGWKDSARLEWRAMPVGALLRALAAAVFLSIVLLPAKALAQGTPTLRALVLGVNRYPNFVNLHTAVGDAQLIAERFREMHFDVRLETEQESAAMQRSLDEFILSLHAGDRAVIYYAGHGATIGQTHYLFPSDARPGTIGARPGTLADPHLIATQELIMRASERGAEVSFIFDACRDPGRVFAVPAQPSILNGFRPLQSEYPGNVLLMFATSEGITAGDASSRCRGHGPFACALSHHMARPISVNALFNDVVRGC